MWNEAEKTAFKVIKQAYLDVSMVRHPDFTQECFIAADSSGYGVGCCLFQCSSNGKDRNVVAYASRTLHGADLYYTVTEKECLAIVFALQQWRVMVLGQELTIVTDHKSLSYIMQF